MCTDQTGTCDTCSHAGRWKLCDFGEAAILRTPTVSFAAPKPWRSKLEPSRFVPITSVELLEAGAHHYAWLRPGERFETESHSALGLPDSDSEEISEPGSCRSFPHGALVYSFSEIPTLAHMKDCVFAVCLDGQKAAEPQPPFPEALRPFSLIPTTELLHPKDPITHPGRVSLDLSASTYELDLDTTFDFSPGEQVKCLRDLYPDGIKGRISRPHREGGGNEDGDEGLLPLSRSLSLPLSSAGSSRELKESRYLATLEQEDNGKKVAWDKAQWRCEKTGTVDERRLFESQCACSSVAVCGSWFR